VLQRIENDDNAAAARLAPGQAYAEPIVPSVAQVELETAPLPRDHPPWVKDAIAVSQRAREILAKLKPVVVRVLCFWDHRLRSITAGGRRVTIDLSGSYRIDS
jgi:hypothetical protein